jgi:hypothetical protein
MALYRSGRFNVMMAILPRCSTNNSGVVDADSVIANAPCFSVAKHLA